MTNWRQVILKPSFIGSSCFIVGVIALILFCWQRPFFHWDLPTDEGVLGTIGDFIGGILGTIIALYGAILMVRTFEHQQSISKRSNAQAEIQRFNNIFFELLRVYQTIVADMTTIQHSEKIEKSDAGDEYKVISESTFRNKDFFDASRKVLYNQFQVTEYVSC